MKRRWRPAAMSGAVACDVCGLVNSPRRGIRLRCPRCGFALEARKPNSITRAWALLIAAAVLYIPANIYPVLAFYELGSGSGHTIIGGAEESPSCGTLAARTPGVPCQHCCAVPQNPGIGDAVNHHAKAVTLATPPAYDALPHRQRDWTLVHGRHIHGIGSRGIGPIRCHCDHRARPWCIGFLWRCYSDDFRC